LPRGKWDYQIGLGVRAEINGQSVLVGSDRFLRQEGIDLSDLQAQHLPLVQAGCNSIIYVASDGQLLGLIAYRDPLRRESRAVIKALGAEGLEIHLLTGDKQQTAHAVAQELRIKTACTHAEAFPEEKVAVVKHLHEQGQTVAFVGDGINDSPALAYADVSVSFANGSEVARETADVVLMENHLRGLPEAIAIAQQAMQLIHQNTGIIAVPNLVAMVLAVAVGIDPLAATLVNNGTTVVAGVNGLRPLLLDSEELNQLAASLEADSQEQDNGSFLTLEATEPANHHQAIPELPLDLQQSLETSSDCAIPGMNGSFNGNGNGNGARKHLMNGSRKAKDEPLTAVALANRLKVSATTSAGERPNLTSRNGLATTIQKG
jgi:soluble P-type ATPase